MVFWGLWFPPKKEGTNSTYYYDNSGRLVFVHFLEEIDDPKNRFEINWPLLNSLIWDEKKRRNIRTKFRNSVCSVFDARFWKMLTNHGKPPYIEADVFRKK